MGVHVEHSFEKMKPQLCFFFKKNYLVPEWHSQIYTVAHRLKEDIPSFQTMCHSSKSVTCTKF